MGKHIASWWKWFKNLKRTEKVYVLAGITAVVSFGFTTAFSLIPDAAQDGQPISVVSNKPVVSADATGIVSGGDTTINADDVRIEWNGGRDKVYEQMTDDRDKLERLVRDHEKLQVRLGQCFRSTADWAGSLSQENPAFANLAESLRRTAEEASVLPKDNADWFCNEMTVRLCKATSAFAKGEYEDVLINLPKDVLSKAALEEALSPELVIDSYWLRGNALYNLSRHKEAREYFSLLIDNNPDDIGARYNRILWMS